MRKISAFFVTAALAIAATGSLARAADYSNPKATVQTCVTAIKSSDVDAIKACFVSDDADQQKQLDGVAQLIAAGHHLKSASIDKFGADGNNIIGGGHRPGSDMGDAIERLKDADEKMDGDTATLTAKPDPNAAADAPAPRPLYFKKVGGDWKIDWDKQTAGQTGPGGAAGRGAMMQKMAPLMAKAMNDTADEVKAGKYATVDEAKTALQLKMREAFSSLIPAGAGRPGQ